MSGSNIHCTICKRLLDVPGDPSTGDCGGDCLRCMAECGDPGAMRIMNDLGLPYNGYKSNEELPQYPQDYPCY